MQYLVAIHNDDVPDFPRLDVVAEIAHIGMGGTLKLSIGAQLPSDIRDCIDKVPIVIPLRHSKDQIYGKHITLWQYSSDGECEYRIHREAFDGDGEEMDEEDEETCTIFAEGFVPLVGEYIEGAVKCPTWGEFAESLQPPV